MHITHEMNMHNCQLCRKEWLGRCFGKKYGKDVSVDNEPCKCYEFGGSKERLKEIENNNLKSAHKKIEELDKKWDNRHDKLAYYIEHDELEKFDTAIIQAKSFVKNDDVSSAIAELETGKFVLEHIERKYKFNLQNIF